MHCLTLIYLWQEIIGTYITQCPWNPYLIYLDNSKFHFLWYTFDSSCTTTCDSSYDFDSIREIREEFERLVHKPIWMVFWCMIPSNLVACSESIFYSEDGGNRYA